MVEEESRNSSKCHSGSGSIKYSATPFIDPQPWAAEAVAVELSATEGEWETGVEETLLAPTRCELELGKEDNEKAAADESLTPVRRKRW